MRACIRLSDATFRDRIGPSDRAFRPVNGLCHADFVCLSPETQVLGEK